MELKPFKELIAMTKDQVDAALVPIQARKVKANSDLAMAKIDTELLSLESEVHEMCTNPNLDIEELIDKLDDIAILEDRKIQVGKRLKELFPE